MSYYVDPSNMAEGNRTLFEGLCPPDSTCIFTKANDPSRPPARPRQTRPRGPTVQLLLLPCYQQLLQRHITPTCETLTVIGAASPIAPRP